MHSHNGIASRLFLSADLIGSTARKQARGTETWTGDVLAFYQQFPAQLEAAIRNCIDSFVKPPPTLQNTTTPELWKAVGDELIYSAPVKDEHEVCVLVKAWIEAMRATEAAVLSKPGLDDEGMDLKGGAWIATFPTPDRRVAVPLPGADFDPDLDPEVVNRLLLSQADEEDGTPSSIRVDYLGPSIDTGFRVISHATARRFPVSIETAWAIALSAVARGDADLMHFGGEVVLKGVWAGRGYPTFWLDTGNQHEGQAAIDDVSGHAPVQNARVRLVAESLHTAKSWPSRIYLPDSTSDEVKACKSELESAAERLAEIIDTSGETPE